MTTSAATLLTRATLDALRCGAEGCTCTLVDLRCAQCGGTEFAVSFAREQGLLLFACGDCLAANAVRVAGEA